MILVNFNIVDYVVLLIGAQCQITKNRSQSLSVQGTRVSPVQTTFINEPLKQRSNIEV